jgi:hypothetical protein
MATILFQLIMAIFLIILSSLAICLTYKRNKAMKKLNDITDSLLKELRKKL